MKSQQTALWISILALAAMSASHAASNPQPESSASQAKSTNTTGIVKSKAAGSISQPSQELIAQKLLLVKMLLAKSAALQRASLGDNPEAQNLASRARDHYAGADQAVKSGETGRANELLDEALRLIEDATRLSPDPLQVEAEHRMRYNKLLEGVRSVQFSYQDLRQRLSPKDSASATVTANLEHIRNLVNQAQALATDGRYQEAGDLLKTAHTAVISALNKLPTSTTVPYEFKFESAAEEFDYEVARYHSYEELAPIAYAELKPGEASINLSERYVGASRTTLGNAKRQAASGDYSAAIKTVLEAIKQLQTALQTVGVSVPE